MFFIENKMFVDVLNYLYLLIRPLIKWFLHKFTSLCELQRACYGSAIGSARTKKVEMSLNMSKKPQIQKMVAALNDLMKSPTELDDLHLRKEIQVKAVNTVLTVKKINPKVHVDFAKAFGICCDKIWGYKRLLYVVESLRTTTYDCENTIHEQKLYDLWSCLMGDEVKLESRVTKQWQDIGFQGDDPKTDFRGMGLLGLDNLLYFAREYQGTARHLLSHSHHPLHGYTFAIVGINITSMAYNLFKSGMARTHFYNLSNAHNFPTIETFHQFYCYLFFEFDRYWVDCKPKSIMDFSDIQRRFENNIVKLLQDDACCFKMNPSIENI